jgi:hypothetical protein
MPNFVFYSWQSDLPNATNRGLIERALEKASKSIRSDQELIVDPVIDRDTANVPGAPDIGATIFEKIVRASIFVADVSIINRNSRFRPSPNPNVLIELGYALKALGWQRIVLVANTNFGPPEKLPFDLRQKRVITYHSAPEDSSRKDGRDQLALALEGAIRPILALHDLRAGNEALEPASFKLDEDHRFRIHRESSLTSFPMKSELGLFTFVSVPLSRISIPEQRLRETFLDTSCTYSWLFNRALSPEIHSDGYTRRSRIGPGEEFGGRAAVTCYRDGYVITEGYIVLPRAMLPALSPAWLIYEVQRHLQLSKELLFDLQPEILLVIRLEELAKLGWAIYLSSRSGDIDRLAPYGGYHGDFLFRVRLDEVHGREKWDIVCAPAKEVLNRVARIFGMESVPQACWAEDGRLFFAGPER